MPNPQNVFAVILVYYHRFFFLPVLMTVFAIKEAGSLSRNIFITKAKHGLTHVNQ